MKNIQKVSRKTDEDNLYDRVKAPLTGLWLMYDDLTDVIRVTVSTGEQRNSRLRGTEEQ